MTPIYEIRWSDGAWVLSLNGEALVTIHAALTLALPARGRVDLDRRLLDALIKIAEIDAGQRLRWAAPEDPGDRELLVTTRSFGGVAVARPTC